MFNRDFFKGNRKIILISILVIILGVIVYFAQENPSVITEGKYIERGDYTGKDKEVSIDAAIGQMNIENIDFEVSKREYSEEELNSLFETGKHDLMVSVNSLKDSEGNITDDIAFVSSLKNSPFSLEWIPGDKNIIDDEGHIMTVERTETRLYVVFLYEEYERIVCINLIVNPSEEVKKRFVKRKIQEELANENMESRYQKELKLPDEIEGVSISFSTKKEKNPLIILISVMISFILFFASAYDKNKEIKERREEILKDYPIVIQKLVMFISAGMTVRNAWAKVCSGKNKGPIYEQMQITENEMETGMSEVVAYERFGERIGEKSIIRFTALLSQNIKRGSTNLSELLSEESDRAFEARKNRAIVKGEQAGTKLLFPMMLLLLTALMIIMVPAFMNL